MKSKSYNLNNLDKLIKELDNYKSKLNSKGLLFCKKLADAGITVAKGSLGEWQGLVTITKEVNENTVIIVARDKRKVTKVWYTDAKLTKTHGYEISPLLLAEFGSGWLADNSKFDIGGVGQGTMPNAYGHAADPQGWYWFDESGVKHHSIGEPPEYPLYNATVEMMLDFNRIAQEVFG